jgi:hypothetical protein
VQQRDRGRRIDQFLWDLQDREEEFERAADGEVAQEPAVESHGVGRQVGQKTREQDEQRPNPKRTTREKQAFFAGLQ